MSNFPTSFDDDTTLPFVNDNITDIGGDAINALRDVAFALEQNIGLGAAGTTLSIAERLGVAFNLDGTLKSSAISSLGLVTLPITHDQIADWAQIPESKLRLDHRTQDLFNYIRDLSSDVNQAVGWISVTGIKLDPHLVGLIYRHDLQQIDVAADPVKFLKNKFGLLRDNTDSYTLINDINNELINHQLLDGSPAVVPSITTVGGDTFPSNYAHLSSGIFLNTSRFQTIPQTSQDLQLFADFIDTSSIFLLGTRIQNLYSNGISKASRSASLSNLNTDGTVIDGYGSPIVPETTAIAYLLNTGLASSPVDDINTGDDIIELKPSASAMSSNSFDAKFAQVKVGDIIRINYGTVQVKFVIKEKKYIQSGGDKKYLVRIVGKNLFYTTTATVRIDRPLFNTNKPGVLSLSPVNNSFLGMPSLIVGSPRGAMTLGLGFDPDLFDTNHYLLYLAIYPTGNPIDGYTILPGIDVTGNKGATPGNYTLDSVVEATNNALRQPGFNYRFIVFSYQGEFGIMLADSYNNTGFSILNATVKPDGTLDSLNTGINFPKNVIGMFSPPTIPPDPLGLGPYGSSVASPPFMLSYGSAEASLNPTKLFLPLKRNNYYVNGVEKEKLNVEPFQLQDRYGDGYWAATIKSRTVFPGAPPVGRVETTYNIPIDLSISGLKVGKTIVVQSLGQGGLVDFGRFIIKDINISCPPNPFTDITVYDAVHGTGLTPVSTLGVDGKVAIYFDSDAVSFNTENSTDFTNANPFNRHFEVYINEDATTFTHERARIKTSGASNINGVTIYFSSEISKINIIKVSPKLRGYIFGSVNKITLHIIDYNSVTGNYSGELALYDGIVYTKKGPLTTGKKGEIIRFYDETNVDYIDFIYGLDNSISNFSNLPLDIQLFPTLSLDDEVMLIGTCQVNDSTKIVNYIRDERQFGNISEKELSTSALNFISAGDRLLHENGVIRGFDVVEILNNIVTLKGGVALVNGRIIQKNNTTTILPPIKELYTSIQFDTIQWALCINDRGQIQAIPLLDFDFSLSVPSDPLRLFKAFNPVNGQQYDIDASTFSNILNNRKDLTILYIVVTVTT